jgi:hypothetical protein
MSFVSAGDFGLGLPSPERTIWTVFNYLAGIDLTRLGQRRNRRQPVRWGPMRLRPGSFDNKTLCSGSTPRPCTRSGAPNGRHLDVTPSGLVSGGFVGGPFNPGDVWYLVRIPGLSITWSLSSVDFWNFASQFSGHFAGVVDVGQCRDQRRRQQLRPPACSRTCTRSRCWRYQRESVHGPASASTGLQQVAVGLASPGVPGGPCVDGGRRARRVRDGHQVSIFVRSI